MQLGFKEEANPENTGKQACLPHKPVIRKDVKTTKIRPVFDGSVHFRHRRSFNANREIGPYLNPDIMGILMQCRRHKIAWIADIEKAFLQIAIQPDHKQMARFVWVDNINTLDPMIKHYVWKRLPFDYCPLIFKSLAKPLETERRGACRDLKRDPRSALRRRLDGGNRNEEEEVT